MAKDPMMSSHAFNCPRTRLPEELLLSVLFWAELGITYSLTTKSKFEFISLEYPPCQCVRSRHRRQRLLGNYLGNFDAPILVSEKQPS